MCGLCGFVELGAPRSRERLSKLLDVMSGTLKHRGPDSDGQWLDAENGLGFGHRRLAIIDLSPAGHQPMHSADGRFVIAYNGEIYNHQMLRKELEGKGCRFRGHSDTEVILAAVSTWGAEEAIGHLNGMFAYALWDRNHNSLQLVRDRLGKKPLYYGWMGDSFLFGSELKALRAHPSYRHEIDRDALASFLRFSYIPSPSTITKGIAKLPAGCHVTLKDLEPGQLPRPIVYWSPAMAMRRGREQPFVGDTQEALAELETLLSNAVNTRMVADVPVGALLSGGIDSSTVVALMRSQSDRPVRTFSIGYDDRQYDESTHARKVASYLGTEHTELRVSARQALDVIPGLPHLYDEPFADASQIPTFLVAKLARQDVTVALTGDGGDETFAGYNRYLWVDRITRAAAWAPRPLRKFVSAALRGISPGTWDRVFDVTLPLARRPSRPGESLHKVAEVLASDSLMEVYRRLTSQWDHPSSVVLESNESDPQPDPGVEPDAIAESMMCLDMSSYLPDDLLVKVDRASMGVSLELRAPLLDHRVTEFAWSLPLSMKIRDGKGKWLLRQLLEKHVPRKLVDRPKMGFAVPISTWLRGPLKPWAEELLDPQRLKSEGFFDPQPIMEKWHEHQTEQRNWQYQLWSVLMFQAWNNEHATRYG